MPRRSSFSDEDVFAQVAAELVERGSLRLNELSVRAGISIGSIYHRFGSREGLMAQAWLSSVEQFQSRFMDALHNADARTGVEAALVTPRFCRSHLHAAVILACCRRSEFVGEDAPAELAHRIATVNEAPAQALRTFARRIDRPLLSCRLALIAYPLAAVRLFLPAQPVPERIDEEVAKAYRAAIGEA